MRLTPFFKAFLVTADVPEIYIQEFWATATVYHHSIRFKMDNKKHIINLESFREMLYICPRLPHQPFVEPPFEEEILAFLCFLRYSAVIRKLTDVEHKDTKKCNEMYYLRFTKVIIHQFMSKDPSIPRRNKVNWHYVRDDHMFSTIKLVSKHQNTQQFDALLTIELTNEDIRNSNAYKEYYAISTGVTPPKPKASGKQAAKASKSNSLSALSENSTNEEGDDDEGKDGDGDGDGDNGEEGDDDDDDADDDGEEGNDDQEDEGDDEKDDEEEGNGEENLGRNVGREEGNNEKEEEEEDELYRDVNINQGRGIQTTQEFEDSHVTLTSVNSDGQQQSSSMSSQFVTSMLNPTPDAGMESIFEMTSQMDVQTPTSVAPLPMSAPTFTSSTIATITTTQQAPLPSTTAPSTLLQDLPNFGSLFRFDHRLKTLEANFSKFMQTNQFVGAISAIPGIAQADNDEFLRTIDENMQKIIKEQVKEQVKRNLYKALIDAYKSDKIILDTYGDTVILKRRRDDDADKDEELAAGPDLGSKRCKEGKEHESASAPTETATRSAGADDQPIVKSSQHPEWFSQQRKPPTPDCDWNKTLTATHGSIQPWISALAKQSDSRSSFNELMGTPVDFSNFLMNRLRVYTLTPELLAGPTYELMKGSCKSLQYPHNLLKPLPLILNNRGRRVIPFDHFINNDLEYLRGGASSRKYTTSVTKTKAADYGHIKCIEDLFYGFAVNWESARDVYIKRRIIAVTELKIVEWHNYKHLDWITVQRDDDKLYNFKEGDFKRLRIQDIKDIIIIQRRVEDLQLGVKIYQKKLNLSKPDTYRSDLKRKEAYIAYSNLRGFIYQNKDKKNRLMLIDELHKFSDGMLIDVRTALDDHLKGIQMQYLPQLIWRKSDKDRAAAMIQAIYKRLKTRRIMRSLERFVGGRLYNGDLRMLQRTI
uniref:Uncharacterized protein n=1 Tax=Tanacetum cinerariifolium TaxID=118510 RepID=A0A699H6E8_TANCI|nr:hypothetical protein [Tanacetum cinerariifolium]